MDIAKKQYVPDIDFDRFSLGSIVDLFDRDKIFINLDYQRGDIWSEKQQVALIDSILNCYSIGVLVLYVNSDNKFEILDGQQRLLAIRKYLTGNMNVKKYNLQPYGELSLDDLNYVNGYSIGYLKLKSHNQQTKEEDVIQTFLRLQEGSPLNKAEKINAYRGKFKDVFRKAKEENSFFGLLRNDRRFRLRLLSAELLHLELEVDFVHSRFPGLELKSLLHSCEKYKIDIPSNKVRFFCGNLDILKHSLNTVATGLKPRDTVPFYLLVSYLRKNKAGNEKLKNELSIFFENFLQKLNEFSIYDKESPKEMDEEDFLKFKEYKIQGRKATVSSSIEFRFNFLKEKYGKFIKKDLERFYSIEQKRVLFFRQKGMCAKCHKAIDFDKDNSAHHKVAHRDGGITKDLNNAVLLHTSCHLELEEEIKKQNKQNR